MVIENYLNEVEEFHDREHVLSILARKPMNPGSPLLRHLFFLSLLVALMPSGVSAGAGKYQNFRVAIYVVVNATQALADPKEFARAYERVSRQLKFDKVYIEVYRDRRFASDDQIEAVKKFFHDKGIAVAGGITLAAGGQNGQFGTFDYESAADRAECEQAVRLAAKHFDEVIMDDFFFYTSKSDADIAAKGTRSWTQYRLDTMRNVSRELVLAPARSVNSRIRVIIKYPNWYEHFQGLGYDLEKEAQMYDGIYTGTERATPSSPISFSSNTKATGSFGISTTFVRVAMAAAGSTRSARVTSIATRSSCGTHCSPKRPRSRCSTGQPWPIPMRSRRAIARHGKPSRRISTGTKW
jgi:hypothetical protein